MKVSIIIPTYKPKSYLWDCLNSIYNQTLDKSEYEVILILNGCSKPWQTEILDWKEKHQNLNLNFIQTDTPGVSNARNIGIRNANGEFITFIDDDDKISEIYLENLYNSVKRRDNCIAVSNVLTFDEAGKIGEDYITQAFRNSKDRESDNLFQMRRFLSSACCKIIPRNLIGNTRFNPIFAKGEDSLFMASISDKIENVVLSSESAIYYRRLRTGSASRSKVKLSDHLKNKYKLIYEYMRIYFSNIHNFNLSFFLSRIIAQVINR